MKMHCSLLLFLSLLIMDTGVAEDKPHLVRKRFVPGKTEHGASFSGLRPGPGKDGELFLQAWAGIGDKFPVKNQAGATLFDVAVVDGDDDHLVMEIRAKEGIQKIDVKRDKSETAAVAGTRYIVSYPSVSVSSAEEATSNQAMLIISLPPIAPADASRAYILEIAPFADTVASGHLEFVFIVNGIAYRSFAALKDRVASLPSGASLTWAPSDMRTTTEQPLSTDAELKEFEAHCTAHNVRFIRVPAG